MTDIFQEVEEDVRRDQVARLWRQYGPYFLAAAVGMVIAVGAISAWRSYDTKRLAERSRAFLKASEMSVSDPRASADALAAIADKGGGYAIVARFREAAARVEGGDRAKAIAIYEKLSSDADGDDLLQDLASLRAAYLMVDSASLGDLKARLAPVIKDTSPWRFSGRELLAFAEMKAGETTSAVALFEALAIDPHTPEGIHGRAVDMLAALGKGTARAEAKGGSQSGVQQGEPQTGTPDIGKPQGGKAEMGKAETGTKPGVAAKADGSGE